MTWKAWTRSLTRNLGAKILSLVLAVGIWFTVTNQIEFEQELTFPIEYVNPPAGLTSVEELPGEVRARVFGKGRFLGYRLREGVCRVDLASCRIGQNNLVIDGGNLVLPREVPISRKEVLEPRSIAVEFDKTVARDVPVRAEVRGSPHAKFVQVGKTFVNPPEARVKGPRKLVDPIALISTEEIDIDGDRGSFRKHVPLVVPGGGTVEVMPSTVEVGITIEPLITRTIEEVALQAGGLRVGWEGEFLPASVEVELSGARSIVEVATEEVTALVLHARAWSLGKTIVRLKTIRGTEIVFAPQDSFPDAAAEEGEEADPSAEAVPSAQEGKKRGGKGKPLGAVPAAGGGEGKMPDAVGGDLVGKLPLPGDVQVVGVEPERIVVTVRKARPPEERP